MDQLVSGRYRDKIGANIDDMDFFLYEGLVDGHDATEIEGRGVEQPLYLSVLVYASRLGCDTVHDLLDFLQKRFSDILVALAFPEKVLGSLPMSRTVGCRAVVATVSSARRTACRRSAQRTAPEMMDRRTSR